MYSTKKQRNPSKEWPISKPNDNVWRAALGGDMYTNIRIRRSDFDTVKDACDVICLFIFISRTRKRQVLNGLHKRVNLLKSSTYVYTCGN